MFIWVIYHNASILFHNLFYMAAYVSMKFVVFNNNKQYMFIQCHYLEMMFELERFFAFRAFELAEHCALVVAYHVPLETVHVGECFVAHLA